MNKHNQDALGHVWDDKMGLWVPNKPGIQAYDNYYGAYLPVMGVLGNKTPGYTRLAFTPVDDNLNPVGVGGYAPNVVRIGPRYNSDFGGPQATGYYGKEFALSPSTNPSGVNLSSPSATYWTHIKTLVVSNTSQADTWIRVRLDPDIGEAVRFKAPKDATVVYAGEDVIVQGWPGQRPFIYTESAVDSLYVYPLLWFGSWQ
jgi:hypothetical protein